MRARDKERAAARDAKEGRRYAALLLVIRRAFAQAEGGDLARMSNQALADSIGVSRRTLHRWMHRGEFIRAGQIVACAVRKRREQQGEAQLADIEARLSALIRQHQAARVRWPKPL